MIILSKSNCILFYKVDPYYFEKFDRVICDYTARSYWRTIPGDAYSFTNAISFYAGTSQGDRSFLEFKHSLVCNVKIENEKEDALSILTFIKEQHELMNLFIEENSLSYYSKLQLQHFQITASAQNRMEAKIGDLKNMKRFEDKSEIEKQIEQEISRNEMKVRTSIVKTGEL